jgi:membrane-associated phospholipid phosphatase
MAFAETGLGLAWGLLVIWLPALDLTVTVPRLRGLVPDPIRLPVLIGACGVTTLVLGQAAVVNGVADRAGPGLFDRSVLGWFLAARSPAVTVLMKVAGHALGSMVVLGVLAAVVVLAGRRAAQVGAVVLATAGISVIAVSRLYLGVHWVTDVFTAWLLGGAWLVACVTALTLLDARAPSPATPTTISRSWRLIPTGRQYEGRSDPLPAHCAP